MTLNLYLWDSTFLSSIISRHPTRIYLRGGTVGTHRHGAVCAASWRHGHCADDTANLGPRAASLIPPLLSVGGAGGGGFALERRGGD